METVAEPLPRWTMSSVFPSLDSPAFDAAFEALVDAIGALSNLYDAHGVHRRPAGVGDPPPGDAVDEVLARTNAVAERLETVQSYLRAFVATDAGDARAQARAATLRPHAAQFDYLTTRLTAWLGSLDADALLARSAAARDHEYLLRRAATAARHQLPDAEEALAAALAPSGAVAWQRLHADLTARLVVPITLRGRAATLPISVIHSLGRDPDPAVRRAAYAAELAVWPTVEVPLAAALNGVKGAAVELAARRGWPDAVAPSLHANAIDSAVLAAMHAAVEAALPDFRRYLRAKARHLGIERLAWWDLTIPVGAPARRWPYAAACAFIAEVFGRYSPRLAGLARRAVGEGWIDAEPRAGKEGTGFWMGVRPGESRILLNYDGTFRSVQVLAHELGHAYHHSCLAGRTPLQRRLPMTLAETASTFCEALVEAAALEQSAGDERLAILDASLSNARVGVVTVHAVFRFEREVFARRAHRDLAPRELSAILVDELRRAYGDGVDEATAHPYLWAIWPHLYMPELSYYNYPYTFGLLFSLGLAARRAAAPAAFAAAFDDLLAHTGLADAADLAARFGFDLRAPAFWVAGLDLLRARIEQYEALAPPPAAAPARR
jgi:pepF/M3 family oligoendopeptidase